jgi:hypothetical protein
VQALAGAGYQVDAINPLQVARDRGRHGVSGANSDADHAHTLADMAGTDRHQLRPIAGDSVQVKAIKVVTRAHKTLIWEPTRHALRLRHALREFFPAALAAFDDLTAPEALELLGRARIRRQRPGRRPPRSPRRCTAPADTRRPPRPRRSPPRWAPSSCASPRG